MSDTVGMGFVTGKVFDAVRRVVLAYADSLDWEEVSIIKDDELREFLVLVFEVVDYQSPKYFVSSKKDHRVSLKKLAAMFVKKVDFDNAYTDLFKRIMRAVVKSGLFKGEGK